MGYDEGVAAGYRGVFGEGLESAESDFVVIVLVSSSSLFEDGEGRENAEEDGDEDAGEVEGRHESVLKVGGEDEGRKDDA